MKGECVCSHEESIHAVATSFICFYHNNCGGALLNMLFNFIFYFVTNYILFEVICFIIFTSLVMIHSTYIAVFLHNEIIFQL